MRGDVPIINPYPFCYLPQEYYICACLNRMQ